MKTPHLILSLIAVGIGGMLTSCVDPYYAGTTTHTRVTEYRPGYVVQSLPSRYDTETIGGVRYYRNDDVYFRPQGDRYVVVEPPRGSRYFSERRDYDGRGSYTRQSTIVRNLPDGARVVTHRGTRYYRYGDTYYEPYGQDYVVVNSPF